MQRRSWPFELKHRREARQRKQARAKRPDAEAYKMGFELQRLAGAWFAF